MDRKPDISADTAPAPRLLKATLQPLRLRSAVYLIFRPSPVENVKVRCMAGSRKMSLNSGVKSAMKGRHKRGNPRRHPAHRTTRQYRKDLRRNLARRGQQRNGRRSAPCFTQGRPLAPHRKDDAGACGPAQKQSGDKLILPLYL